MSEALINITYNGQSGNYFAQLAGGTDDATVLRVTEEAVRSGEVAGIDSRVPSGAFADHVVDRFVREDGPRFVVRPRVPFG